MSIVEIIKKIPPCSKLAAASAFVLLGSAIVEQCQKTPNVHATDTVGLIAVFGLMFFGLGAIREWGTDDTAACEQRWSRPLDSDPPL